MANLQIAESQEAAAARSAAQTLILKISMSLAAVGFAIIIVVSRFIEMSPHLHGQ